ncbi:MAG: 4Fe-4S dicluster domain-containing protein [Candidatus Methanofastidiosa archaeon]|nr:4Fe-4S dicluster domain-containing protein [Candidatus Methanofastidiosa archaeon]
MDRLIVVDVEKCTGCRLCELMCSLHHEGSVRPSYSRIHAISWDEEGVSVPVLCSQCDDAPCVAACRYEALWRDPSTGAIVAMEDRCIGCKMCIVACPYGCMGYDKSRHKVFKCDLCGGEPECCRICPTDALRFIRSEKTAIDRKRSFASPIFRQYFH